MTLKLSLVWNCPQWCARSPLGSASWAGFQQNAVRISLSRRQMPIWSALHTAQSPVHRFGTTVAFHRPLLFHTRCTRQHLRVHIHGNTDQTRCLRQEDWGLLVAHVGSGFKSSSQWVLEPSPHSLNKLSLGCWDFRETLNSTSSVAKLHWAGPLSLFWSSNLTTGSAPPCIKSSLRSGPLSPRKCFWRPSATLNTTPAPPGESFTTLPAASSSQPPVLTTLCTSSPFLSVLPFSARLFPSWDASQASFSAFAATLSSCSEVFADAQSLPFWTKPGPFFFKSVNRWPETLALISTEFFPLCHRQIQSLTNSTTLSF